MVRRGCGILRRGTVLWFLLLGLLSAFWGDAVYAGPAASAGSGVAPRRQVTQPVRLRAGQKARPSRGTAHRITLGAVDVEKLRAEDRLTSDMPGVPRRIGMNRTLPQGLVSSETDGQWLTLADDVLVWTLEMDVPQAKAVRLHFSRFELPDGARVLVSDTGGNVIGVYTGTGPNQKGSFWAAAVPGGQVHVEYQSADPGSADEAPVDLTEFPIIEIDQVCHIYDDPTDEVLAGMASETSNPVATPLSLLTCHEDVSCYTVDAAARDAVGRMTYISGGYSYLCSGALLNDADANTYAGYFLTANHCVDTQAVADTITVYWFYQTDTCDGPYPSLFTLPQSLGGTLLATAAGTDFTLMRLADDPHDGQGFAAWTTNDPAPAEPLTSIHHPNGAYKRLSIGSLTSDEPICGGFPLTDYWYLQWSTGVVESGSSGGPLFNSSWEVVGQLYGLCHEPEIVPGCDNRDQYNAMYGKFGVTYPAISTYLSSVTPDDAYEDNDTLAQAVTLDRGTYALKLVDLDDYFRVILPVDGLLNVRATFNTADMDLDLQVLNIVGEVLYTSANGTGIEVVTEDLPKGTYLVRVIKSHLWGGDYSLLVSAPRFRGDFDLDGDVDLEDFGHFQECLSGVDVPQPAAECLNTRLDGDSDVDTVDLNMFRGCLSGPFIQPPSECGI